MRLLDWLLDHPIVIGLCAGWLLARTFDVWTR